MKRGEFLVVVRLVCHQIPAVMPFVNKRLYLVFNVTHLSSTCYVQADVFSSGSLHLVENQKIQNGVIIGLLEWRMGLSFG